MLSVLKICNCKFLGEEFCVSSVMNLAYETIFATFTGRGKLEHGTSDKQLHFLSTLIRGEEGEVLLIGCVPFGESKNGFLILDLPDFGVERNMKSEIGFVTLVTFRQRVQYARQPLQK